MASVCGGISPCAVIAEVGAKVFELQLCTNLVVLRQLVITKEIKRIDIDGAGSRGSAFS